MKRLIFMVLVVLPFACAEKEHPSLVGTWRKVDAQKYDDYPPAIFRRNKNEYVFLNDSLVDTKWPYGGLKTPTSITKYRYANDSLSFFNPYDSTWSDAEAVRITRDSLVFPDRAYTRFEYKLDSTPPFDQIGLSTSGCFGRCPIMDIIIKADGEVVFHGERFHNKIGYYQGRITPGKFKEIAREFSKTRIDTLQQYYALRVTDMSTTSTTFMNGGKIINTINDYAGAGPDELEWAYPYLQNLPDEIELTRMDTTVFPFQGTITGFDHKTDGTSVNFTDAQQFLLWNFLRLAKKVDTVIPKGTDLYTVQYMEEPYDAKKVTSITTDGRYYRFEYTNKSVATFDIGVNFLELHPNRPHFSLPKK